MGGRRYVVSSVPAGYRIGGHKTRRWWGDLYELCSDGLLDELRMRGYDKIMAFVKRYRAMKR